MKPMSKTKMAAIAAIVVWPISYLIGYRSGLVNMVAGAAVFLWAFELLNADPVVEKKKRSRGARPS
jgi:hypothetical protein